MVQNSKDLYGCAENISAPISFPRKHDPISQGGHYSKLQLIRVEKLWHLCPPMSRCKETVPFIIIIFYVLAAPHGMQDLSSSTRNQTHLSPAVQA